MFLVFALLGCAPALNVDADGDGVRMPLDCDDGDPAVAPGVGETCGNGVDDDCDGYAAGCGPGGQMSLTMADVRIVGDADSLLGNEQMAAGADVTGDGLDDVILAASSSDDSGASVYVLAGPLDAEALLGARAANIQLYGEQYHSPSLALTDLDGDGRAELVVAEQAEKIEDVYVGAVSVFSDPARPGLEVGDADASFDVSNAGYFPMVAAIGDTDEDGLGGFVVGVNGTRDDDSEGGVWVVQGPVVGALEIAEVGVRTLGLNDMRSVAGGDSDGDGLDEVFVNTDAAIWIGRDGAFVEVAPGTAGSYTGCLAVGDADGDGYADLYTARTTDVGTTQLFPGPTFAEPVLTVLTASRVASVALPGDIDGDGTGDLLIGTPDGCWDHGCAWQHSGARTGTIQHPEADAVLIGETSNDHAGDFVSGAGDMNADGGADLLVWASAYRTPTGESGAAYVLFGGPGL